VLTPKQFSIATPEADVRRRTLSIFGRRHFRSFLEPGHLSPTINVTDARKLADGANTFMIQTELSECVYLKYGTQLAHSETRMIDSTCGGETVGLMGRKSVPSR
jgi:hypothetical protein